MHQDVRRRLRERWPYMRDAFLYWDSDRLDEVRVASTQKAQDALARLRFPSLIVFLQCMTIDDPVIERGDRLFPMISADRLPEITGPMGEEDVHYVEHHQNSIENLSARFQDTFLREWLFHPSSDGPRDEHVFTEYQTVYQELRQQQRQIGATRSGHSKSQPPFARRRIWAETVERLLSTPTVTLAKKTYAVPQDWTNYVSSSRPPAEVARILLAGASGYDFQDVKERLARLRREVPVRQAWTNYDEWLHAHPERFKELEVLIRGWPGMLATSHSTRSPRAASSSAPWSPSPPPRDWTGERGQGPLLRWPREWLYIAAPDGPKNIPSAPNS